MFITHIMRLLGKGRTDFPSRSVNNLREQGKEIGLGFLLLLGSAAWMRVPTGKQGLAEFGPPMLSTKGGSTQAFLLACPDVGQKEKNES